MFISLNRNGVALLLNLSRRVLLQSAPMASFDAVNVEIV
jgi:hypothetical protein